MPTLQLTLLPARATRLVGQYAPKLSFSSGSRRRLALFAGSALGAYLLTLVAGAPASLVLPRSTGAIATGTIWSGDAVLPGGDRLRWDWSPLRSLAQFGFSTDWTIIGRRTELSGTALLRPGMVRLARVRGDISAATLTSSAQLPFACDMIMTFRMPQATFGGAAHSLSGSVRTRRGTCWPKGTTGPATPVPALALTTEADGAEGTTMRVGRMAAPATDLVRAGLSPAGRLDLNITSEGATMLPFAAPPGGVKLQFDL